MHSTKKSTKKKRKRDADYDEDDDFDPSHYNSAGETEEYDYHDSSDQGSRNHSYKNKKKDSKTRKKTKRRRRKKFDSNYEDDSDDQYSYLGNKPQHQFWRMVEEFFQPVHNDPEKLKLLNIVNIEEDPDISQIPALGPHYSQKWTDHQSSDSTNANVQNYVDVEIAGDYFDSSTISQRLLQSIVEERDAPMSRKGKKGRPSKFGRSKYDSSSSFQPGFEGTTDDYSSTEVSGMDQKILVELQELGLMSDEMIQNRMNMSQPQQNSKDGSDSAQQDDEVLSELKRLQQTLIAHVKKTDAFRRSIRNAVQAKAAEEEALVQQRKQDVKTISDYEYRFQFHPKKRH